MADVLQSTAASLAADTLLRTAGGRSVLLRTPSPGTPGDATEQLGLITPSFQDVELSPVVLRKAQAATAAGKAPRWELLVSASAVHAVVGTFAFNSASVIFATAFGVLVDDTLMEIEAATSSSAFGSPYVYRLVLRAPLTSAT
ncbi:hypothetical protein [Granulicella arctica]|uniref:hypothetical protein n=1 Tax=Granulicella arctica TaxID=940613 RepID=UPI0021E02D92|nr:hypothetical protein [Granulicella arctica]